jgi:O-antigen/teichoic acid export membrane protein
MSFIKNISFTFGSQIVTSFLTFVASIYLTRILGSEGRGVYAIFINALAFATLFFGFSIQSSVIYLINSGKVELSRLLGSLFLFCFISTGAVFLALVLLIDVDLIYVALPENFQSPLYILLFVFMYMASLVNSVVAAIMSAFKRFTAQGVLSLIPAAFSLITYVLVYHFWLAEINGQGFRFVLIVTLASLILTTVFTGTFLARELGITPSLSLLHLRDLRILFAFSLVAYFGNVLQVLSYRLDFWFVDFYSGKSQLGIYSLATQLVQLLWLLPNAAATVLYSHAASKSSTDAIRLAQKLAGTVLFATVVCSGGLAIVFHFSITDLYGSEFGQAVPLILILIVGTIPFSIATILGAFFASRGQYKTNLYGAMGGFLISLVLYPSLIRSYGVWGGAWASSISYITNTAILIYFARKHGMSLKEMLMDYKSFRLRTTDYDR